MRFSEIFEEMKGGNVERVVVVGRGGVVRGMMVEEKERIGRIGEGVVFEGGGGER